MKYFHGSRSLFQEFSYPGTGKHGTGFYFTADKNEAHYFAKSLYGNGVDKNPTVYTVQLKVLNPFNTMSINDCIKVCQHYGFEYKEPKNPGGAKEHYHYLQSQLKKQGLTADTNELIKGAGFDAIWYEFMDHMIVLSPEQIQIIETESLDT